MALPNLAPYQPSGWSDKIVVSRTTGTTTDSTGLSTADTLYVDWTVVNNGNATAGAFTTYIYVDGAHKSSWTSDSLPANTYSYANDYSIGSLSAGTHTITITADPIGAIAESNEGDNSYTKTVTVSGPSLPNLTPYQPSGWSDKIVVSRTTGTTTDSTGLSAADTLYVDWTVVNNGNATAGAFTTYIYVDGAHKSSWTSDSLLANTYSYANDYSIGSLSAGTHTITITADPIGAIAESNEGDNSYTKTVTVTTANLPTPTLRSPANGGTGQSRTPSFAWSAVPGATSYRIIVATSAPDLPSDPTSGTGGPSVLINATTTDASYIPSVPLSGATTYYWEVHARNNSQFGTWSSVNNFTTSPIESGLTIIPTFDSSITSDPQAATIESTINAAIATYQSSFSDPITVYITFQEMNGGLGQSTDRHFQQVLYSDYLAALKSHATTADDATALAHLPNSAANPLNNNQYVNLILPLARALGFSYVPPPGPDGTVSLNTTIMNLSAAQTDSSKYSLFAVVSHEIDEVLGFDSALNGLNNGAPSPTGPVFPEDLFRYDQNGNRSLTTAATATAFFSLDGTTDLAQFNQQEGGDFQDWYSYPYGARIPQVQDAFLAPGVTPVLRVELQALDVIGYHRVPLPITISASSGTGGTISPNASFNKQAGESQFFTASPSLNYVVDQWRVDDNVMQTGGASYTLSNIQINHTVQVTFTYIPPKSDQTITFAPLGNRSFGDLPFTVSATSSSGLPVGIAIYSGPATCAGNMVTISGAGTIIVRASQGGNATYNPAPDVDQTVIVTKANQTITFNPLQNRSDGEPQFSVSATASSGLLVSFEILTGPATISGNRVTITGTGVISIRASQAGSMNYNSAPNADQAFSVYPPPALTLAQLRINEVLTWPTNVAGFGLESTPSLAPVISWSPVFPAPVIVGGAYTVTNNAPGGNRFYRLKK
jgi:hypothetical protein